MNFKDVAVEAAKIAGKIHLTYFNTDSLHIRSKSTPQDRVTIADKEAEKAIVAHIRKSFPDHNILGEEDDYEKTDSPYLWVIDPLDGTNNFSKGFPLFCCSIALAHEGEVIVGVVYDSFHDEMFIAEKGKGATLNGKKISVTGLSTIRDSLLIFGTYYNRDESLRKTLEQVESFLKAEALGTRRTGTAALDLAYVAAGRVDGFWEWKLSPWDYAAGIILIEEAGGKMTDYDGKDLKLESSSIVASNGKIHEKMLEVVG